jgi:Family of unknown function (DUF6264)
MSELNGTSDPRPRPKYGELAPEGWTWTPPPDVQRLDTARPLPAARAPVPEPETGYGYDPENPFATEHRVAPWNRSATLSLIVIGFIGMMISVEWFAALPDQLQIFYTTQGLGTYHPAASVAGIIMSAEITQAAIWVASTIGATLLLSHKRSSFYVPLLAGVIAGVLLFVFTSAVLATDSTLINYYSTL